MYGPSQPLFSRLDCDSSNHSRLGVVASHIYFFSIKDYYIFLASKFRVPFAGIIHFAEREKWSNYGYLLNLSDLMLSRVSVKFCKSAPWAREGATDLSNYMFYQDMQSLFESNQVYNILCYFLGIDFRKWMNCVFTKLTIKKIIINFQKVNFSTKKIFAKVILQK